MRKITDAIKLQWLSKTKEEYEDSIKSEFVLKRISSYVIILAKN